jgi:hypothetical protein
MSEQATIDILLRFVPLEHHVQFLRALRDVLQGKIAEERREHLSVVASEDDDG